MRGPTVTRRLAALPRISGPDHGAGPRPPESIAAAGRLVLHPGAGSRRARKDIMTPHQQRMSEFRHALPDPLGQELKPKTPTEADTVKELARLVDEAVASGKVECLLEAQPDGTVRKWYRGTGRP